MNNLYKRFMTQHVKKQEGLPEGDLCWDEYGEKRNWEEGRDYRRTRSRSRGRKRRDSSNSSSSRSSSSSEDSSPKKKKKKKEKKHKKKKKNSAKKKKRDASDSESEEEGKKKDDGPDWRVELLKRMKDIKSLPPEQLETEFKKAMAEKKRREEEEKCIQEIEKRQKMARKVKKESDKAAKKAAKEKAKRESKSKAGSEENEGGDGFYNGYNEAMLKQMEDPNHIPWIPADEQAAENPFKSSFAEVPFVPEDLQQHIANCQDIQEAENGEALAQAQEQAALLLAEEEMDPYAKALSEQLKKEPKDDLGGDVSWPAGAIENAFNDPAYEQHDTKEQIEAAQEAEENVCIDDNTKSVMNTSKMFSKVRNRIKKRPLNIHLKTNKLSTEDDEGLGLTLATEGEATPGEVLSGEEMGKEGGQYTYYEAGYVGEVVGDEYDMTLGNSARESNERSARESKEKEPGRLTDDEEERRVARYRERARKRRERAKESGELEDGEHSPSPEPERPHHRRRRKRRHEREGRERRGRDGTPVMDEEAGAGGLEDGEIGDQPEQREGSRGPFHMDGHRGEGRPGGVLGQGLLCPPPAQGQNIPFVDTSVPPPTMSGPPVAPPPFVRAGQSERGGSYGSAPVGDRSGSFGPVPVAERAGSYGPAPVTERGGTYSTTPSGDRSGSYGHGPVPGGERGGSFGPAPVGDRGYGSVQAGSAFPPPLDRPGAPYPPPQPAPFSPFQGPPTPNNYPPMGSQQNYNRPAPQHPPSPHFNSRPQTTSPNYLGPSPNIPKPPSPTYLAPPPRQFDAYSGSRPFPAPAPPPAVPIFNPEGGAFFDSLPRQKSPSVAADLDSQLEPVDSEEDDDSVDITKVSPIMKYIAGKLVEQKYHLELSGPFRYNSNIPGLSKHLFVSYKMVTMLEDAGYNGSKMYMSAMFPAGMKDTKAALVELVTSGKMDPRIKGGRLIKMCVRCIRCFLAYYTGKNDDIDTSDGECSEESGEEEIEVRKKTNKTVTTSLMDVLGRIKDEKDTPDKESEDPLSSVLNKAPAPITASRYSAEDNPWSNMELGMRSNNLKTFTALQSHFTKQLVGKGVDHRDAREQSSESMMCFVVANFTDTMLRHMVTTWKKVILPEQSQLEVNRYGKEMTLFDQIVAKLLKHQSEFPLSIIQEVKSEPDWQAALLVKMRNIVERMLKFYMRGLGKMQDGKEVLMVGSSAPTDPTELQFNYLPEGLREEENRPPIPPQPKVDSNFFNMEQAAMANRSFSSYKRTSLDEQLSPVSPEQGGNVANMGNLGGMSKGALPRQKYLFGTFYIDTLLYQGSSYVYELGVYMSDSSSCEVYIVPTKLFKQNSVLEMLGFSFNPDEKKYIYMKPGTGGFSKTYSEEHGLDRIMQFLKERRFESRGDSENRGLVLTAQTVEDLATWVKFSSFHRKDWELKDIVAGYGCLDLFIEESKGLFGYIGPKLHREREANQTYFTWEYTRTGYHSEAMSAGKADALYTLLERLLDNRPNYDNFIKTNCFGVNSRQYGEIERRFEIIKDMYNLEYHLATSLNVRAEKRRLFTEGIFCPRTTAELGDKPGLVAARMVRILSEFGYSKHSLNSQIVEARERGTQFTFPIQRIVERMRNLEHRQKSEQQILIVTKYIEDYFLRR